MLFFDTAWSDAEVVRRRMDTTTRLAIDSAHIYDDCCNSALGERRTTDIFRDKMSAHYAR